jgi:hypothetical protein
MGNLDLVKPTLERIGTVHFGRLLMKPGKPTTCVGDFVCCVRVIVCCVCVWGGGGEWVEFPPWSW